MSDQRALSSEELFKLAEQRRKEDERVQRTQAKGRRRELKARQGEADRGHDRQTRQLEAGRTRQRAAVEQEISRLTGNPSSSRRGRATSASTKIMELLQAQAR